MAFDPTKHRKTSQKLATLQNSKQLVWKIAKPQKKDYVQIYGNSQVLTSNSLDKTRIIQRFIIPSLVIGQNKLRSFSESKNFLVV